MATFFFFLSLLLASSTAQEANTDGFFVKEFLQKMGGEIPPATGEGEASPSVCSWRGISCDFKGERVLRLSAAGVGLSGDIPENTIGKLNMLQHLDLSNNKVTGFSSDFWGIGSSLRSLNLSFNRISGSLPNDLGNFGLLESLDLSGNLVSGEIPTTVSSLSSLKLLNLRENKLEGKIPDGILGCKSLSSVDLSSNRLSGRLVNFSTLDSLSSLNLSGNLLQGSVHEAFHVPLRVLDLSRNQFQGSVSSAPSFNWSRLELLDLSENHLSGELFPDLNQARYLTHLYLARNRFSRQKFPDLRNLSRLRYLNLSATGLSGSIHPGLSALSGLILLDLSKNHLTGRIPDLKSAINLAQIDLSFNNLTGEIPPALLRKLPHLKSFNFSFNNLTLCSSKLPLQSYKSSFLGSQNDCPFAANPELTQINQTRQWKLKIAIYITIAAGALFFFAAVLWLSLFYLKSRRRSTKQQSLKEDSIISGTLSFHTSFSVPLIIFEKPLLSFTFSDLLSATSNFDRGTLLAEGRSGAVYSGFLPGDLHVAIKILAKSSSPPDEETAVRELDRLGRVRHPNIVPLSGYCIAGDQRITVYEFMENGNLQNLLHDLPLGVNATEDWSNDSWDEEKDGAQSITSEGLATWRFRHKIALGIARALAYLHHGCIPQIIHKNVRSSSIYLDSSFEPRLGDFGLAKLIGGEIEEEISKGSPGYSPPELEGGSAEAKSDVYAFGVVLFELVTGKKPVGDEYEEGEKSLVGWVRGLAKKNELALAVDPKVGETGPEKQTEEALRIGYLCTAESPSKRPSMQQIVGLLKDIEPQ